MFRERLHAGLCGCASSWLGATPADLAKEPSADERRLAAVRYQLAKSVGFLGAEALAATCATALEKTGCECAEMGTLVDAFKGEPAGHSAAAAEAWGNEFIWDKACQLRHPRRRRRRTGLAPGQPAMKYVSVVQFLGRLSGAGLRSPLRQTRPGDAEVVQARG